jgi:integrase
MTAALATVPVAEARAGQAAGPLQQWPPRIPAKAWPACWFSQEEALAWATRDRFRLATAGGQKRRAAGLRLLLEWLAAQPGQTWQQRWMASGADGMGPEWRQLPARWMREQGCYPAGKASLFGGALVVAIAADLLRPSLAWLAVSAPRGGALVRAMEAGRDTAGFTRLREQCADDPDVGRAAMVHTLHRAALLLAAHGGTIEGIAAGDVLELADVEEDAFTRPMGHGAVIYRMLHRMGVLGLAAPSSMRELTATGRRTPEELVDRYALACRPVRDLLVDYLKERQPALDYSSLRALSADLAGGFWKDLERHHPGIASLRLPDEVASAWKQRLRTREKVVTGGNGDRSTVTVERIGYRQCLTPVRAFYLDLAQWALDEPERWAQWVAPCPVGAEEINQRKAARQRKSRMDARTRERLPALPGLLRRIGDRRRSAAQLLTAANQALPGEAFAFAGKTFTRAAVSRHGSGKAWITDQGTGRRRDPGKEEDIAFWTWAAAEILRSTGIRVEELLEITHHSLVQYRLPGTGELVPLLQIAPSKTDTERLLVISPELADVVSAIICRIRDSTGAVPLIPAYDRRECQWLAPAPFLFQRLIGTERRRICDSTIRNMLTRAMPDTGAEDSTAGHLPRYTPHDFRRIFITDAIMSGLPPHIAQVIAGHHDINVTLGYKAVYPEEAIQAHLAFLTRRRALRPSEEYRAPTDEEWAEFIGHFERRKVSTGTCGRAFGTPCIHEHACVRCPMLWPDPAQRERLTEIRDNLTARITEAEREGWLGEVEGLKISLAGAQDKLAQIGRRSRSGPVDLGLLQTPTAPQPA